jgi:hypothetical protein
MTKHERFMGSGAEYTVNARRCRPKGRHLGVPSPCHASAMSHQMELISEHLFHTE